MDPLVNPNFMEDAIKQAQTEAAEDAVVDPVTVDDSSDEFESDMEVPESSFFNNDGDEEPAPEPESGDLGQLSDDSLDDAEAGDIPQTGAVHKYKADGKEFEIDLSTEEGQAEALKALSLVSGARKAFSAKAKLQKALKQERAKHTEVSEKVKLFDQLEKIHDSGDDRMIFKALTGKSLDDVIQRETEKARLRENATPEQLALLDKEDAYQKANARLQKLEAKSATDAEERAKDKVESSRQSMQSSLLPEFQKHTQQFSGHSQVTQNKLKKMLWKTTIDDLIGYAEQGYDVSNPRIYRKVMANNAKAMKVFSAKGASEGASKIIEGKKKEAVESAQAAASRNYPDKKQLKDLSKLNPLDLFNKLK